MKLYVLDKQGVWGDVDSHPLPATVEVIPTVEMGTAEINGTPVGISDGKFVIDDIADGINTVRLNGIPCEPIFCRTINGGTRRINAIGQDLRAILPYLARITTLEGIVARHESQLKQKDFFG